MNVYRYKFIGDFGREELTYREYLKNGTLRKMMNDRNRVRLNLGLTQLSYDPDWLDKNPEEAEKIDMLRMQQEENPLMFFMPSGFQARDFLNDTNHTVKMMIAPNRVGKSATAIIDILLDAIPTDPSWPIFKEHGVKHRKWHKEIECGFASADWSVMKRTVWPEIRKWIPKYELGDYDPRKSKYKEPSWRDNPQIKLQCDSMFYFFCYEQSQAPFESQALDRFFWDEQGEEAKFDGGDERLRTKKGRHVFAMTPHRVEGRPDTGARSWIHKMYLGTSPKGHTVSKYHIPIDDVPDWVYPEKAKRQAYKKWIVQPEKEKNLKAQKEGRARYYGEFHDSGGLVYDDWSDAHHVIDEFDIPSTWTRYRAVDHGVVNPTACTWWAVNPEGDIFLYDEYYKGDMTVSENCRAIIRKSGNKVKEGKAMEVGRSGMWLPRCKEEQSTTRFRYTLLDSRSRGSKEATTQITLGKLYEVNGLRTTKASALPVTDLVPMVRLYLRVDMEQQHPYNGIVGRPKMFIFRNCVNFRREIKEYAMQEYKSTKEGAKHNLKEKPVSKNDHLMNTMEWVIAIPPKHIEGKWVFNRGDDEDWDDKPKRIPRFIRDKYTGY